jgi:hypothetical protein
VAQTARRDDTEEPPALPQAVSTLEQMTSGTFQRLLPDDGVVGTSARRTAARAPHPVVQRQGLLRPRQAPRGTPRARGRRAPAPRTALPVERRRPRRGPRPLPPTRRVLWVQEEPENMGSWTFVRPLIEDSRRPASRGALQPLARYVGRVASASPATGSPDSHALERKLILEEAFATSPVHPSPDSLESPCPARSKSPPSASPSPKPSSPTGCKAVGARVEVDQPLVELETDKVTMSPLRRTVARRPGRGAAKRRAADHLQRGRHVRR